VLTEVITTISSPTSKHQVSKRSNMEDELVSAYFFLARRRDPMPQIGQSTKGLSEGDVRAFVDGAAEVPFWQNCRIDTWRLDVA
jgi:hypothetical protein